VRTMTSQNPSGDEARRRARLLLRPFATEAKGDWSNRAAVPSFSDYVLTWVDKALEAGPSPEGADALKRVRVLFQGYPAASQGQRREATAEAHKLLSEAFGLEGRARSRATPAPARPPERPPRLSEQRTLARSVQYVKGVGGKRAELLAKKGVRTVEDLLFYFPRDWRDRRDVTAAADLVPGTEATVKGRVVTAGKASRARRAPLLVAVDDGTGVVYGAWWRYRDAFVERFKPGDQVVMSGKVELNRYIDGVQMSHPDVELVGGGEEFLRTGRIVPVYSLTEGLPGGVMLKLMHEAVSNYAHAVPEIFTKATVERLGLLPRTEAIAQVHFPTEPDSLERALRRLKLEEFLVFQLGVMLARKRSQPLGSERAKGDVAGGRALLSALEDAVPFEPTAGQREAIEEIFEEMASGRPMARLVQGDVASGKTYVAAAAAAVAVGSGAQVALMAPTELLAQQHLLTLGRWFSPLGVRVELLTGGLSAAEKRRVLKAVSGGEADVVVGTHALLEEAVGFADLGLVVVDEQHRFGVLQRSALAGKGRAPHMLVLTATPIPRSLALTLYGDLDVTTVRDAPEGRGVVSTFLATGPERAGVYEFMRSQLDEGRQAFVICPLVEESDALDARSASRTRDELAEGFLKGCDVELLHGRMSSEEKTGRMDRFRGGEAQVLVSTTVVEVGVDVPNASVLVVEGADRFGLAQLHQLRGRISRSPHPAYCFLVTSSPTEEARRRLDVMLATSDGFAVAREDLRLRGPGEFLGTRQHGMPEFRLGCIVEDVALIEEAREEARRILKADPRLEAEEHAALREEVLRKMAGLPGLVS